MAKRSKHTAQSTNGTAAKPETAQRRGPTELEKYWLNARRRESISIVNDAALIMRNLPFDHIGRVAMRGLIADARTLKEHIDAALSEGIDVGDIPF